MVERVGPVAATAAPHHMLVATAVAPRLASYLLAFEQAALPKKNSPYAGQTRREQQKS